jgi:hypothetical protein
VFLLRIIVNRPWGQFASGTFGMRAPTVGGLPVGRQAVALSRARKLAYSLVLLVIMAGLLEAGARLADWKWRFRHRVLAALDSVEKMDEPIPPPRRLDWPAGSLYVRLTADLPKDPRVFRVGGRRIPDGDPRRHTHGFIQPESIAPDKPRRVFCLGGSTALGYLYPYDQTYAGILQQRLGPQGFAIVNAAESGRQSSHFVPVVRRITERFDPQVVILFMGNNEWTKWGLPEQLGADGWRVPLYRCLAHSRLLAGVEFLLFRDADEDREEILAERMGFERHRRMSIHGTLDALDHPFERSFSTDPGTLLTSKECFLDAFERNLRTMVAEIRSVDARPILVTVPFYYKLSPSWNFDQPIAYDPAARDRIHEAATRAAQWILDRRFTEAIELIDEMLRIEPRSAVLHHQRGQALEALDRHAEALEAYSLCREHMVGHLAHRMSINERIRHVAEETSSTLVDVKRIFDEYGRAHEDYYGQTLIADECHPTPLGHVLIADALEAVLRGGEGVESIVGFRR